MGLKNQDMTTMLRLLDAYPTDHLALHSQPKYGCRNRPISEYLRVLYINVVCSHHHHTELQDDVEQFFQLIEKGILRPFHQSNFHPSKNCDTRCFLCLRIHQGDLPVNNTEICAMRLDECAKATFFLVGKLCELLPLTLDHFEMAICLNLSHEMNHLGHC